MAVNPAMITLGREARGWTQKDLAGAIRTRQGTVSRYEMGLSPVPQYLHDAISESLRFSPEFFTLDCQVLRPGGDLLYRKKAHVPAKTLRRVEAEVNIRKMQIEVMLRHVDIPQPFPFPAILPEEVERKIRLIAREVRRAWRIPRGPIQNLTRVIEDAGAIIFTIDFGTNAIDGTNVRKPGLPPLLFLNCNAPGDRHRFNLGHELGHVVMHFSTGGGKEEDEANHFARELLMPFDEIRSDLKNLDLGSAARLKRVWGVSMAALITQAYCLRQIPESRYRRLFTQLNASNQRLEEPLPLPFEEPARFQQLQGFYQDLLGITDEEIGRTLFTRQLGEIAPPAPLAPLKIAEPTLFDD